MTQEELRKRVRFHNRLKLGTGLLLIPGSLALWFASFWIFRVLFAIPLGALGFSGWTISFYLSLAAMVLLAVEGVRYGRPLFDLSEYARSGYRDNLVLQSESGRALSDHYGNPMGVAFLVSQVLFCAPRSTVHAIGAFRSVLHVEENTLAEAARILADLRRSRKWTPASTCLESRAALMLLRRLRLIWVRSDGGEFEFRHPAGEE